MSCIERQAAVCVEVSEKLHSPSSRGKTPQLRLNRQRDWFSGFENSLPLLGLALSNRSRSSPRILHHRHFKRKRGDNVNRMEFIFRTVNVIASKKQEPIIECMLAEAVLLEIENFRQKQCVTPAAGHHVAATQS